MFAPTLYRSPVQTAFIVEDDVGKFGRVFSETDVARADRETTLNNLYTHQYHDPVRVIAFNTQQGWSRDVSVEVADKVLRKVESAHGALPSATRAFLEEHLGFSVDRAQGL